MSRSGVNLLETLNRWKYPLLGAAALIAIVIFMVPDDPKDKSDASGKRAWSFATLDQSTPLSDFAVYEGRLYAVSAENKRAVYVASLANLQGRAAIPMKALELDINRETPISGGDAFAQEGYNVGHLWDVPLSFVGIAIRPPNRLYLAESTHRLIYWGDVVIGADGNVTHARLDWAFTLRGGVRRDALKSDWRDKSAGLDGLTAVRRARPVEDLYALDRSGGTPETAGFRRLDRTGGQLGAPIRITGADGKRPDIRGVVWEAVNDRFLALVGGGRGSLVPFKDNARRVVRLGAGIPGPKYEGVTGWTAMTRADDGRLFLLSENTPPVIAWRAPEQKATVKPR